MSAPDRKASPGRWIAIVASIVVVATLAAAVVVIGPPSRQRLQRLDEHRVADLGRIVQATQAYHDAHDRLPASLAVLAAEPGSRLPIADPATAAGYGYAVLGTRGYQLCARFDTDTADTVDAPVAWAPGEWNHSVGLRCFKRSITGPAKQGG